MTTPEPPLSAPLASSQALPADRDTPAVLPPIETLRAARQWATEHRHQQPDDRMLAIVYAAGVAAGEARGRTAAAADLRAWQRQTRKGTVVDDVLDIAARIAEGEDRG